MFFANKKTQHNKRKIVNESCLVFIARGIFNFTHNIQKKTFQRLLNDTSCVFSDNFILYLTKFSKNMKKKLNILIAPLNWGLGHATRCMPIINALLAKGHNIIIATDGHALDLLKKEYPNLPSLQIVGYNISYGKGNLGFVMSMFWQLPKIFWKIFSSLSLF